MHYAALTVAAALALAIPPALAGDDAIVVYKSLDAAERRARCGQLSLDQGTRDPEVRDLDAAVA